MEITKPAWYQSTDPSTPDVVCGGHQIPVCTIAQTNDNFKDNMALIIEAPVLLSTLKMCLGELKAVRGQVNNSYELELAIYTAEKTIAAAENTEVVRTDNLYKGWPEWANYKATDKIGDMFFYELKPILKEYGYWVGGGHHQFIGRCNRCDDWQNSLIKRQR